MSKLSRSLLSSGLLVFTAFVWVAEQAYAAPNNAPAAGNQEIDWRVNDLAQVLDSQQTNAEYWEYGWGAFDGGTMIWSAVQARQDDNRKDRNTDIVQASESLIGLADVIFRPLPALYADSVCRDPVLSQQDLLQCLSAREAMLEKSAERAHEPYELLPHLGNLGFNVVAGLIVSRVADTRHALITAIPGEVIGEAQIWTTPTQPIADSDRYKLQFGPLVQQTEGAPVPEAGLMATFKF